MLNQQTVETGLLQWLVEFIEQPHPNLGNWPPCPYARQARLNNAYTILEGTDILTDGVNLTANWDSTKEVVIVWYKDLPVDQLVDQTKELNKLIMPNNFVALEGHPNLEETINGVDLRFKLCPILVIQQLAQLNQAADQLKSKGYYDHWSQDNLDKIVNFRYNKP